MQFDTVEYQSVSDGLPYEKRADGKGEVKCIKKEAPFDLPEGWSWARVNAVCPVGTGATPLKTNKAYYENGTIPWIKSGSATKVTITEPDGYITELALQETNCVVYPAESLVVAMYGEGKTRGSVATLRIDAATNQACAVLRKIEKGCLQSYVKICYENSYDALREKAQGGNQPNLSQTVVSGLLIPVPPLAEQRRIVDALDRYLALVDAIERDRADLEGLLAQLKSKVLDLAVRGELTERGPGDEPASELLAHVREEKLAMVERGELKPKDVKGDTVIFTGSDGLRYEKPADGRGEPRRIEDEIPFELPEGWAWARLGQIVATRGGKTPSKAIKEFWEDGGVPWITSKDMKAAELYGSQIELAPLGAAETGTVPAGSVLMVVRSGILRRLLPVAINRVETTINQDLKAMTPFRGGFSEWLLTCFSAWDKRIRDTYHKDGTTVDSIEFDSMLTMLLPVPPLAEQRRIVERVEELFNLLD
ncbi:Type-1 restriction enzyme EcoKI specificity protein [Collinsella aerofaciens]|nr:Type-1 restriction enzyme EcoKI specificity protein [Collinsella aerofaciens]